MSDTVSLLKASGGEVTGAGEPATTILLNGHAVTLPSGYFCLDHGLALLSTLVEVGSSKADSQLVKVPGITDC